jgi:hypothetical protein
VIAHSREESGRLRLDHYCRQPNVYLDMAPLMAIAEHHAERFQRALESTGGTLALSWVHLLEFSKVGDDGTVSPVVSLLLKVWPNIVFIEVDPGPVVAAENDLMRARATGVPRHEWRAPHLDDETLMAYWETAHAESHASPNLLALLNLYRTPESRSFLQARWDAFVAARQRDLYRAVELFRQDATVRRNVLGPIKGSRTEYPTRHVHLAADRFLIKNGGAFSKPNDVADFLHTVVPVSYCDFVVLDKGWVAAAAQVQKAVADADLLTHRATVFRVSEVPKFIERLETWRAAPGPPPC